MVAAIVGPCPPGSSSSRRRTRDRTDAGGSRWGVDEGEAAFLSGGYDKGVVLGGVARAAKKSGSSLSSPLPSPEAGATWD